MEKKNFQNEIFFFVLFIPSNHQFIAKAEGQEIFSAVTSFDELEDMYTLTRETKADTNVNVEIRKNICRSITSSAYFEMNGREHLDTNGVGVLRELRSEARYEEKQPYPIIYFKKLIEGFEVKKFGNIDYNYRSVPITFSLGLTKVEEFAFACLVRHQLSNGIAIYYVSDAYTMSGNVKARFVCIAVYSCELQTIAEEPAIAFASPEFLVENVYLQMRKYYREAKTALVDPVCGLRKSEKLRICASALNSTHFAGKVKFFPHSEDFDGECELREVSFRKNSAKNRSTREESYKEWMLHCSVDPRVSSYSFSYFISRAYHSHYAVVYSHNYDTDERYIENISGGISPIIEKSIAIIVKYRELVPPLLTDLLKENYVLPEENEDP